MKDSVVTTQNIYQKLLINYSMQSLLNEIKITMRLKKAVKFQNQRCNMHSSSKKDLKNQTTMATYPKFFLTAIYISILSGIWKAVKTALDIPELYCK